MTGMMSALKRTIVCCRPSEFYPVENVLDGTHNHWILRFSRKSAVVAFFR